MYKQIFNSYIHGVLLKNNFEKKYEDVLELLNCKDIF